MVTLNKFRNYIFILFIFFISCVSAPRIPPRNNDASALAVQVHLRAPIRFFKPAPKVIFFARLSSNNNLYSSRIYYSNHNSWNKYFLLNIEPGWYTMVGAYFDQTEHKYMKNKKTGKREYTSTGKKNRFYVYFSEKIIRASAVYVTKGYIHYLGNFLIDTDLTFSKPLDTYQSYYQSEIRFFNPKITLALGKIKINLPGIPNSDQNPFLSALAGTFFYSGSLKKIDQSSKNEIQFFNKIKNSFTEGRWGKQLNRTLAYIQSKDLSNHMPDNK